MFMGLATSFSRENICLNGWFKLNGGRQIGRKFTGGIDHAFFSGLRLPTLTNVSFFRLPVIGLWSGPNLQEDDGVIYGSAFRKHISTYYVMQKSRKTMSRYT